MNFTGVAPGAKLGMYKVFSCLGSGTTDDVLIAALSVLSSSYPFHWLHGGDYTWNCLAHIISRPC